MSMNRTAAMFHWLDIVARDKALPPAAFKLGFLISQHVNAKSGTAWPGRSRLSDLMGLKERQVTNLVNALVSAGHITCTRGRGRTRSSVYTLVIPPEIADENTVTDCASTPSKRCKKPTDKGAKDCATEPTEETPPRRNKAGGGVGAHARGASPFGSRSRSRRRPQSSHGKDEALSYLDELTKD